MAKHSARGSLQWYVLKQVSIATFFILFALTLLGVALFYHHTLKVALTGFEQG